MYTIESEKVPAAHSKEVDINNEAKTSLQPDLSSSYAKRKKPSTVMTMVISYARDLVLFTLLFVLTAYATYQNTPLKVSRAPPPSSFIQNTTLIEDFTTGKLVPTQTNVALSEISFVLYYAPWCAESRNVRQVYENVAREFHGIAYFAAINCWEPRGECRIQYANVPSWPTLMAYRSTGVGIQYNGAWTEEALGQFIRSLMHPMVRLDNVEDLINLSTTRTIVVCAFLDITRNFTAFRNYYQTALKFLEVDPTRDLVFAVCLGRNVRSFGMDSDETPKLRVYAWNNVYEYKNSSTWMQYELVTWIRHTVKSVTDWATPLGTKANDIGARFTERAALIVFTPRTYSTEMSSIIDMIKQFGYSYKNCNNDTWLQRLNHNYIRQVRHGNLPAFSNLYTTASTSCDGSGEASSTFGLYADPDEPQNTCTGKKQDDEFLDALTSISGYACLNHKNFSIIFMDSSEYSIFAERYVPRATEMEKNKTRIILIDSEDETVHELKHLSPQNISNFIRDYTEGNLKHIKRSLYSLPTNFAESQKKDEGSASYNIKEITSRQFEHNVLAHNKTTFVLYHSSYCAFCQTMSYYLLSVARYFDKLPFIDFYRIDVDKNDLDEKYTVVNLPALVVFPANRKDEVRIFPRNKEVNTANLISFIFSNLPKSTRLNVLMMLCNDFKSVFTKFCASTLRKEVSSNISQALKNWSAARNGTQKSFESRKIYHLKKMYVHLLNSDIKSFKGVEKELLSYVSL